MECGIIFCTKSLEVELRADDAANESEACNTIIDKASANRNGKEVRGDSARESVAGRISVTTDDTVT